MITDKKVYHAQAIKFLEAFASRNQTFLMEDVGEYAKSNGLDDPLETRWWGGVAHKARALGLIESTGTFKTCSKGKGNPRYMMVWRSKVFTA